MTRVRPPSVEDRFICVVHSEAIALAAVVSSYLFRADTYFPLFMFPPVSTPRSRSGADSPESYLSNMLGNETAGFINNAWARMQGSDYLILAGLTENQKSYLIIPTGTNTIDIANLADVQQKLSPLTSIDGGEKIHCKTSETLVGLFTAQRVGKALAIDESAASLPPVDMTGAGVIVVENVNDAAGVVAVNYASSVRANLSVVNPLVGYERQRVQRAIFDWKEHNDSVQRDLVLRAISDRIKGMSFAEVDYATFFTKGLPYSLYIENLIPCSYVNLSLKPDLFVFNAIIFESIDKTHSAVLFSPDFFEDEETQWLLEFFSRNSYFVRPLLGPDATFANLDFTVQHFPYDVLHICSHGGEVDGWEVVEQFVDRNGTPHVIEYDEVVGFDSVPDENGRIAVHRKTIFRKLDGVEWESDEKERIPQYVFHDMWKALYQDQRGKLNPDAKRSKKGQITASCAIRCADSIHQGEFHVLASHGSPLVFNNTCWSWREVAAFFLAKGARAYIGTLWAIDNEAAILGARTFYENIFSDTILGAFHKAVQAVGDTPSKDIYVYWGLHFTTLDVGESADESRSRVFRGLLEAVGQWRRQLDSSRDAEVRKNATRILAAVLQELNSNFSAEDMKRLEIEARKGTGSEPRSQRSEGDSSEIPISARSSIEHPIEYRFGQK